MPAHSLAILALSGTFCMCPFPIPQVSSVGSGTLSGRTGFLFLALLFGFVTRVAPRGSGTCPPWPHSWAEPAVGSRSGAASAGGVGRAWVLGPLLSMVWGGHRVRGQTGPLAAGHQGAGTCTQACALPIGSPHARPHGPGFWGTVRHCAGASRTLSHDP